MDEPKLTEADFAQFHGGGDQYRHWLGGCYTEGVRYVAEHGEAYWLIGAAFSHQGNPLAKQEGFQVWVLSRLPVEVAGVIPAIHDNDQTWHDAQRLLAGTRKAKFRSDKDDRALAGCLVCGHCGCRLTARCRVTGGPQHAAGDAAEAGLHGDAVLAGEPSGPEWVAGGPVGAGLGEDRGFVPLAHRVGCGVL